MPAILKQHEGSLVSPKDDAVLNLLFNDQNGIIKGCKITHVNTNQILVEDGYAYICGRLVQVEEETVISPFAGQTGASGELILKLDILSDTPARLIARAPRQDLVQEDINGGGTVYEYLLATYTVTDVKISELMTVYEMVSSGTSHETVDPMLATEPGFPADAKATKEAINNCFQFVSNGKALIASAITDKKVTTDANASFATMAANIRKIKAAATALSGSKSIWVSEAHGVGTGIVTFSTPFSAAPQINYSVKFQTGNATFSSSKESVTITRKTAAGFEIKTNGLNEKYGTYIIDWNATG